MGCALALDYDRVVEVVRGASQVGEVRDAPAEQYRYQADVDFVYQTQVEGLPRDVGGCDGDIFVAGDFPGTRDAFSRHR